jgi:hemerythrin-like metal-binding protein
MDNKLVEWDERYSVGIQMIDEQHQELISQVNNLYLGRKRGGEVPAQASGSKEMKLFFDLNIRSFLSYVSYHFSSEEKMLERIGYPDLLAHRQQHSSLFKVISEVTEFFEKEDLSLPSNQNKLRDFVTYLRDMLINHIAIMDKKYVSFIHFVNRKVERRAAEPAPPTELFIG